MIGRILRSADFERVLGTAAHARSAHFSVHYLKSGLSRAHVAKPAEISTKLSTGMAPEQGKPVDEIEMPDACWLGAVVPKRHARHSVTRNLIKRQIREAARTAPPLRPGLWVVRLRSPFDPKRFLSAASDALREEAARELQRLMADAAHRAAL